MRIITKAASTNQHVCEPLITFMLIKTNYFFYYLHSNYLYTLFHLPQPPSSTHQPISLERFTHLLNFSTQITHLKANSTKETTQPTHPTHSTHSKNFPSSNQHTQLKPFNPLNPPNPPLNYPTTHSTLPIPHSTLPIPYSTIQPPTQLSQSPTQLPNHPPQPPGWEGRTSMEQQKPYSLVTWASCGAKHLSDTLSVSF